jgi:hypothetical protein
MCFANRSIVLALSTLGGSGMDDAKAAIEQATDAEMGTPPEASAESPKKGRIEAYGRSSPLVTEPPRLSRPIGDYLANLCVDTVCYHYEALACCYQVLGAEHLLFGTDHPFGAYQVPAELLDRLNCPSSHRDMISTAMPSGCLDSEAPLDGPRSLTAVNGS